MTYTLNVRDQNKMYFKKKKATHYFIFLKIRIKMKSWNLKDKKMYTYNQCLKYIQIYKKINS